MDWAIATELASRRKGHNLHNFPAPQFEDLAHQTTTHPARAQWSTVGRHPPAVFVIPGIPEQHRTCIGCGHANWSFWRQAPIMNNFEIMMGEAIGDFACQYSRHMISFFCMCVNVCPCVSHCPPHSAGLGTATATPVRVWSQELRLLAVLLLEYSIPSSPRKMPRLHHPPWLQTMHAPGHAGFGSPGWLHGACGANVPWTPDVHTTTGASRRTAVPPCPLSSMSLATAKAHLALAMTAQTPRRRWASR